MKTRHLTFIVLLTLLYILASAEMVVNAQDGWERMEDIPSEEVFYSSCLLGNNIYVFGGVVPNQYSVSSVWVYDIDNNSWSDRAHMPVAMWDPQVGSINNLIYLVGGWVDKSDATHTSDLTYMYDPETDEYLPKEKCPFLTGATPSCVLDDKFYVFGNWKQELAPWYADKHVCVYDPTENSWDTLADMNFEHTDVDAVSINHEIYLIGGSKFASAVSSSVEGKSEMYDPNTDKWIILADMPYPVAGNTSVVHANKIVIFGGDTLDYAWTQFHATNLIQVYDPTEDSWQVMEGMPFKHFGSESVKAGNFVYLIGGIVNSNTIVNEVWRFDLNYLEPLSSIDPVQKNTWLFMLHQNYPNPFSGSTKIRYELTAQGRVELAIVNMLGHKLTTLVQEMKSPGSYEYSWNAEGIDPGVYYCKLRVGAINQLKKMVVIR